jgi:GT2 family glycosyltransferase
MSQMPQLSTEHPRHYRPRDARPRIYVVVPVYNRKPLVERFLQCMSEQTFRNFTVIIVDDGSTDGTAAMIEEKFPNVQVLHGDGNLWWTGGTNMGIRHAMLEAVADDAVLIINDDLEIDPAYLSALYRAWQTMPNTLIGSVTVDLAAPDRIICGGERVNWWTAKETIINNGKRLAEFGRNYFVEVSRLTGWGTLIPVHVFRRIGLFDEVHFQQCGDTELPVRARKHGYRLVVCYDAIIKLHVEKTAAINVSTHYHLGDLNRYFFDVKSNFRLKYRFFYCYNTATNPFQFLSYLVFDFVRIVVHFILRLRFVRSRQA